MIKASEFLQDQERPRVPLRIRRRRGPNPQHGGQEEEARWLPHCQARLQKGIHHPLCPALTSPNLFSIPQIEEERRRTKQQQQRPEKTSVVEERKGNKPWLDRGEDEATEVGRDRWDRERRSGLMKFVPDRRWSGGRGGNGGRGGTSCPSSDGGRKFPWSSMRPNRGQRFQILALALFLMDVEIGEITFKNSKMYNTAALYINHDI